MWADAVDPVVKGIETELAALERELGGLRREADMLEGAVRDAQRVAADDERAIELLDRVLGKVVQSARADFAEALERAHSEADADLKATQTAADLILTDLTAVIPPSAGRRAAAGTSRPWWALTGEDLSAAEMPEIPAQRPSVPVRDRWPDDGWAAPPTAPPVSVATEAAASRPAEAPSSPWTVPPVIDAQRSETPVPPDAEQVAAPAPVVEPPVVDAGASPVPPKVTTEMVHSEGAAERFSKFWHHDEAATPVKRMRFDVVDAVLPVVVVAIVLVVLLSWMG